MPCFLPLIAAGDLHTHKYMILYKNIHGMDFSTKNVNLFIEYHDEL